ncbi:hypothetical protein FD47_GL000138 [Lentilactobacillus parafarraginis DSM 18390 = JCM 14109]|uniref:Uncharacterized protein n=2 Tax=Lentilactobacillus parafarraginis TaxID=390842 RepID=A0A0R1YYI4_9LACO|nr:hypothetical protein FD47_GL000138 [Lentilactobacillus parafarraginis DSM 18390 = JCM 14109]
MTMAETNKWAAQQLQKIADDQQSFINKSLLAAAQDLVSEQEKRRQQAQDEIDGRTWSPEKW